MLFFIISAVLVIAGSASWVIGSKVLGEDYGATASILTIVGIVVTVIGLGLAVFSLIKMYSDKKAKEAEKAEKLQKRANINRLVLTSMLIALGTALSLVKVWQMPLGGSITLLSMLPIALISIEYGIGWGFVSAFIYSLIQMGLDLPAVLSWGLSPTAVVGTICLDYVLAFSVLGIAGLFRRKGTVGICIGVFIAIVLRFICHLISGTIIFDIWMPEGWANPLWYSICYNGAYMLPETIITMIASIILFKLPHFNKMVESNMEIKGKSDKKADKKSAEKKKVSAE